MVFNELKMRERKPPLINQQCAMQSASAATRASWHLHQRIDEHHHSPIGRHLKNVHGQKTIGDLSSNFFVLKKCRKIRLPDLRNVVY